MPIANLKITDEQLNSEMSELLLEISHLKEKFKGLGSVIGRGFKKGKPIPKSSLDSFTAFLEAVEDLDVDAARQLLETLPNATELSLPELRRADEVLDKARTILVNRSVTGEGDVLRTLFKFLIEWAEKRELPPLPGETLQRTVDEIVAKRAELQQRRRELEAELGAGLPSSPLDEKPDTGFHEMPFLPDFTVPDSFLEFFEGIPDNSSLIDGASGARSFAGGPAFERLGEVLEMASAAGREFDGAMRDLDETGARVAATFEGEVEGLDALLDGLKQGEGEVDEFGASLTELKDIGRRAFAGLEGALGEFIRTGKFEWRDFARVALGAIGDIFDAQIKAAGAASSGNGGPLGGILDFAGSLLGSILGGGGATPFADAAAAAGIFSPFEHGGRFAANQPILVGEAGPELLVPPMAGEIVPNHALASAAPQQSVNQKFVINISPGVPEAVRAAILQLKPQIQQWAIEGVMAASMRGGAIARMPRI